MLHITGVFRTSRVSKCTCVWCKGHPSGPVTLHDVNEWTDGSEEEAVERIKQTILDENPGHASLGWLLLEVEEV